MGVEEREVLTARVPQHELSDLLFEGYVAGQVGDTFIDGQGGVTVGGSGHGGSRDKRSYFLVFDGIRYKTL